MKYCLIGKKYGPAKRGSYTVTKRFVEHLSEYMDFKQDIEITNYQKESENYKKLIFTLQAPHLYNTKFSFLTLRPLNHLIYIRKESNNIFFNSASNGFNYYKNNDQKHFIPMITDFNTIDKVEDVCIGYYSRVHVNPDVQEYFIDFLSNLPYKINLCTMGDNVYNFSQLPSVNKWFFTNENTNFFSRITHYIYPMSETFIDPFPNSILEAVQCGKQIVLPKLPKRCHIDGVEDLMSCIQYHDNLNLNKYYDNSDCCLNFKSFRSFYDRILNNDFENILDREKYKTFYDWCSHEL